MNNNHRRQNSRGRSTVLKVVILGDGGVGKSCLMNRFVTDRFDEHSFHTIGVEFLNKEIELGGETFTLQIWDTAGQERFKSLRTPFYRGSDMCLLTFSVEDPSSFQNLDTWRKEFVYYADVKADFPFLVVGNKIDLERRVTTEEAEAWCKENGDLPYIETSARDATNVEASFMMCLRRWANIEGRQERMPLPDTVQLGSDGSHHRLCSCSS
ncbi:ras-related protein Rab-9A-like [Homarus americanus]|uniref:ras-related protein Rab-9A-like n=1 Tax=Homarus americanus TaxID=6706 RepID=UPI001C44B4CB|nr:ras-related protein Rab-9A-like [Homarus americanus]